MAKYTQGPWRHAKDEADAEGWWGTFPHNEPACVIVMETPDGTRGIASTNDDGLATEDEYENAKLIVAAVNSYAKNCGERAIEAADGDLLGRALTACEKAQWDKYGECPVCQQIIEHNADCPIGAVLREAGRLK